MRELVEMVDKGRETDIEGIGGGYVPGKVLVVTSVSTVFVKSTTPSRLGGSLSPFTTSSARSIGPPLDCGRDVDSIGLPEA